MATLPRPQDFGTLTAYLRMLERATHALGHAQMLMGQKHLGVAAQLLQQASIDLEAAELYASPLDIAFPSVHARVMDQYKKISESLDELMRVEGP